MTVSKLNAISPVPLNTVKPQISTGMTAGRLSVSITAVTANERSNTLDRKTPSLFHFLLTIRLYNNSVPKQKIRHVTRLITT